MAEYIAHRRLQHRIKASSAGLQPGTIEDASNAIYTLKQFGIDASAHQPRDVRDISLAAFDVIVAMDNSIAKELKQCFPTFDKDVTRLRIKDPYGDDLAEYARCAKVIHQHLMRMFGQDHVDVATP